MEEIRTFAGASKLVAAFRVGCTLSGLSPRGGALPWRKLQREEARPFQFEFSPFIGAAAQKNDQETNFDSQVGTGGR